MQARHQNSPLPPRLLPGLLTGLLLLVLAGCSTSGQRSRYLVQVEPASLTNLLVYVRGTNLQVRIPVRGLDAYAHASWPAPGPGTLTYQHRFAVLTFDKQPHAELAAAVKRTNQVAVRDARHWQDLVRGIFEALVPAAAGHGAIVLVESREMVVFHDASGKLGVVKLEDKPPGVIVDQTFNDADFSREAIKLLQAGVNAISPGENQYLFVTGEDPAFVLIDVSQKLIVFLSYPRDPEMLPFEVPGWFAVRALNSLFLKSLVVTAVKNPVTLVSRGVWQIGTSSAAALQAGTETTSDPIPPLADGPGMDLAAWEARLDHLVAARRFKGKIDFFIDGERFFPALIQSLEAARETIDFAVYIFDNDDYAVKIADLLKRRSAQVRVRVLLDAMGSLFAGQFSGHTRAPVDFLPPGDIISYLEAGSRARARSASNPWLTADHRKCIILDGREAYLGGMNIGREYRYEWHDMMVGLKGPIVGRLEKDFSEAWVHAGPFGDYGYAWVSLFSRLHPRKLEVPEAIDLRPLRTATGKVEIYRAQLEAIQRAQKYIYLENAYFGDDTILRELIRARRRGVDVRVIFPSENDYMIMQTRCQITANRMLENGIRVYAYPGMSHVKAAIYDGWACVGSANFDKLSLRISQELDVGFSDPTAVAQLRHDLFEIDFQRSQELNGPVPLGWEDFFVKALADQL